MQLHTIQPNHRGRRKRRIGRGGKRGTYSGRGMKGQKARGATKIRPAIRDLIKRTPKLRGQEFPALPRRPAATIINVGALKPLLSDGATVTPKTLAAVKMLASAKRPVKLLGSGDPPRKLLVRGVPVSKAARAKIEGAGGKVEGTE